MNEHTLISIQVGKPRTHETPRGPWRTAFFKEPISGPAMLGQTGLEGDGVADTRYHGGPENAVCVYSGDHFAPWQTELPEVDLQPGAIGENFTIEGATEDDVCIGDVFTVGGARVQISKPRQPCSAIARRWGVKDFVERIQRTARTGWYLRVLEEGVVEAPSPMRLVERPCPEWPVAQAFRIFMSRREDRESARALAACELLAPNWREQLVR